MLFNSIDFAIFLPIVFGTYWLIPNTRIRARNLLLLIASYVFYGWWDWNFLLLIVISSTTDYLIGIFMAQQASIKARRLLLSASLLVNLGLLGFFKYYNFFIDNFVTAFTFFGIEFEASRLSIILPVGISFYTFQTLSYTIDIYRRIIKPTHHPIDFFAFVSFFPQLVAGPIERASHLLPQFHTVKKFNYDKSVDGLRQMLWGFFKKIVIADNCAIYVNEIFGNYGEYSASTLLLGAIFFSLQIYGDFSGYSDIAIGTARLFGFKLKQNFAFPYFSRDIAEFWRRWHISLTSWFRDYLYIPLGGSRVGIGKKIRNTFIIFLVSGFWHGANWTFIIWGLLHAIFFLPLLLLNSNRKNVGVVANSSLLPSFRELAQMLSTYLLVVLAWIFFRAPSVGVAIEYTLAIFNKSIFSIPQVGDIKLIAPILILIIFEWINRREKYGFKNSIAIPNVMLRWGTYYGLIAMILLFGTPAQTFIYFQF